MKEDKAKNLINYFGATLIILAIVLLVMTQNINFDFIKAPTIYKDAGFSFNIEEFTKIQQDYFNFRQRMTNFEESIAQFGNTGYVIIVILFLFALKSVITIVPISATCFLSGALLPSLLLAVFVNFLGLAILMSMKYFWGKKFGGGNISKILKRYPFISEFLEHNGSGNPWVLFAFRLVPSFPVNLISQLYGSMKFNFKNYLLISLAGFSLKLVSFTIMGGNVFDPLSSAFIAPIITILFVSGFSMLLINAIISFITKYTGDKYKQNEDKTENIEKE